MVELFEYIIAKELDFFVKEEIIWLEEEDNEEVEVQEEVEEVEMDDQDENPDRKKKFHWRRLMTIVGAFPKWKECK